MHKAPSSNTSDALVHSLSVGIFCAGAGIAPPMNCPNATGELPTAMGVPITVLVAVSITETVLLP